MMGSTIMGQINKWAPLRVLDYINFCIDSWFLDLCLLENNKLFSIMIHILYACYLMTTSISSMMNCSLLLIYSSLSAFHNYNTLSL